MQFEWDQRKAATNLRKHGVAFTDAIAVFSDPLARIFPDPDHSEAEERELIVGCDAAARLLYVSFVERRGNVRIISARRATSREASVHEKYFK
jgi:uncharacterized DUF497 family protein